MLLCLRSTSRRWISAHHNGIVFIIDQSTVGQIGPLWKDAQRITWPYSLRISFSADLDCLDAYTLFKRDRQSHGQSEGRAAIVGLLAIERQDANSAVSLRFELQVIRTL